LESTSNQHTDVPSPYTAHSLDYSPLWRQRLAIHFPIVLILMVVTAHAYQIETMTQLFFATHSPYIGIILKHNLPVIGLFILIHHISWQLNNKVIKILMSATWLALLLFMISDLVVFKLFYKRLDFQEVALFGKEWRAVIRMAFQVASNPENIYITIPFIFTLITPFII
jgi:hypothetical protein